MANRNYEEEREKWLEECEGIPEEKQYAQMLKKLMDLSEEERKKALLGAAVAAIGHGEKLRRYREDLKEPQFEKKVRQNPEKYGEEAQNIIQLLGIDQKVENYKVALEKYHEIMKINQDMLKKMSKIGESYAEATTEEAKQKKLKMYVSLDVKLLYPEEIRREQEAQAARETLCEADKSLREKLHQQK